MCKKVMVIATLAVVAAVVIIGGRRVVSYGRYLKQQAREAIDSRIPPEQEIARLRMELRNLERDDGRHFERVARQGIEVDRLEKRAASFQEKLAKDENRIRAMKTSLVGEGEFVTHNGSRFSRVDFQSELRETAASFKTDEATLASLRDQLSAKKQSYERNRKELSNLKLQRQQMATELQQLETALEKERQAQAQAENTLDDASYRRLRKEMDNIQDRIKVMAKVRELKSAVNSPVRADEERREHDAQIDTYIDNRFGAKTKTE
jgi:predicted  nucleic acid-binding Zn-ribbon protein